MNTLKTDPKLLPNIIFIIIFLIISPFLIYTSINLGTSLFYKFFYFILQGFFTLIVFSKLKHKLYEISIIHLDNAKNIGISKNIFSNIKLIVSIVSYFMVMYLLLKGMARTHIIPFSIFVFLITLEINPKKLFVGNNYIYMSGLLLDEEDRTPTQMKFLLNLKENTIFIRKNEVKNLEFMEGTLFITMSNNSILPVNFEGIDKDKFFEALN
ncbi:hypothetical protein [Clostridium ganghwense]|uniref:Uncharacterized protein n=1 Tax=Clostridium ganghwense TaxID=312089 RepID=A0ABT4CTX0_9CLOT|nr:hypothetical protein [Clostridium ganghwense]MCY6371414.1 hypothetical protein [Clostridium ganghwense]